MHSHQSKLSAAMPWVRSLLSIPLCIAAFNATHYLGAWLSPRAYGTLIDNDQRLLLLLYILLAGIAAVFVVVAVARHRAWLHVAALCAIGLAIDLPAVFNDFAGEPGWFRVLVIALLPVQGIVGKILATGTWSRIP
jgi:hypothetical protein